MINDRYNFEIQSDMAAKMMHEAHQKLIQELDFSEVEMKLLELFDVQTVSASKIFGVKPEDVTPEQRRHAKAVNFGVLYGKKHEIF